MAVHKLETATLYSSLLSDINVIIFIFIYMEIWGTAVAQWLRHCATNRKVAGSVPDDVIGIFH